MSNASGAEPRLARVTYLPGVVPPTAPLASAARTIPEAPTPEQLRARIDEILDKGQPAVAPETDGERSARAHNVSMHALTRRGLSIQEMTEHLRGRELDEAAVDYEVTRLIQVGLLNDTELADNLVRTLRERKGLGRTAITAELRRRKLDSVAIEQALDADREDHGDDELTRARELAVRRAPQLRSLDAETARRRLGAYLMRKGYSGSIVASAVASALAPTSRNPPTATGPRFQ